ncbi:CatB-related O-acetyltransferase [Vibrio cholerae]|uniref:CatB-related O-acetyltransferase n=1 Tax=Vibrio cholerae TaxID=666 RepID=UPI0005C6571B|nr:CatB-related O-acetyltransferase [Vibrio cholerae]MEB5557706.1 antibiotic acetyltransferase [Vibrio cholerae]BCN21996.1 putative acetyltransferase [Vibrio cholerae]HBC3477439.1 CatB-related O-acetyltransferase [Vibrio cholerae]HBK7246976.1 CatB-related O-acetyltransferase [Vibrio cholerae]HDL9435609.1 CatB-related O-acetyltransferase [Vibrio cholerae]
MTKIYVILFLILKKLKVNEFESGMLRRLFFKISGTEVGLYSYGCFDLVRIPPNTKIGRYCSFSRSCVFLNANHPLEEVSLHPYFYNAALGYVKKDRVKRTQFDVGDDVWIGHNATILASCSKIGRGAVIAAGAVVTKDVPPYAVVAGAPAKILKYRFDSKKQEKIEASEWWLKDKYSNLKNFLEK